MRVVVLYHPQSEHGGLVEDFAKEFEAYKGKKLELVSLETTEGADLATLYDITSYPAFLAVDDSGTMQRVWQGSTMPLMDELSYYIHEPDRPISHETKLIKIPSHIGGLNPLVT